MTDRPMVLAFDCNQGKPCSRGAAEGAMVEPVRTAELLEIVGKLLENAA